MIPFSPPRIDRKIIDEIIDTLKSGWITTGPKTKLFEKRISAYSGCRSVLCTSSATAGLELILRWFGVKEGDEVIVPAYTYCATANVVIHCNATPVMVDVNRDDFNIQLKAIEKAITPRTKVIIPVDIAGMPCDYNEINELVHKENIQKNFNPENENQQKLGRILILSDAAHSIGGEYKGKKTGSLTDITVFSFHAVKNLTTAEGGAICLNLPEPFDNDQLYRYLNILSLHGQTKDALQKNQAGQWRYDVIEAGFKANMTDIAAAMGLIELTRYEDDMLVKRKAVFDYYTRSFEKYDWAEIPSYQNELKKSSFHAYLLRIKGISEAQRDQIIQKIFNKEVNVNVHFQPLPLLTFYKNKGYKMNDYPVAYDNYQREISLPVYYDLSGEQLETIVSAVVESVNEVI